MPPLNQLPLNYSDVAVLLRSIESLIKALVYAIFPYLCRFQSLRHSEEEHWKLSVLLSVSRSSFLTSILSGRTRGAPQLPDSGKTLHSRTDKWDCREPPNENKHSFTKETLHEFPKDLKGKSCKVGRWSRRDMRTVSMARLCLLVYGVLVVGRFRAAVSESDVTPRLNFSYSKCRRLETTKQPELALAYFNNPFVGVILSCQATCSI